MSLGSSLGNLTPSETSKFLWSFSDVLGPSDALLIGLDACQDDDRVFRAYNDKGGTTREFYLNGLAHANALMGKEAFKKADWDVIGEYDARAKRHQAFYVALANVIVDGARIKAGERIGFEESYKYSKLQSSDMWQDAGLMVKAIFGNSTDDYREFSSFSTSILAWSILQPHLFFKNKPIRHTQMHHKCGKIRSVPIISSLRLSLYVGVVGAYTISAFTRGVLSAYIPCLHNKPENGTG